MVFIKWQNFLIVGTILHMHNPGNTALIFTVKAWGVNRRFL